MDISILENEKLSSTDFYSVNFKVGEEEVLTTLTVSNNEHGTNLLDVEFIEEPSLEIKVRVLHYIKLNFNEIIGG